MPEDPADRDAVLEGLRAEDGALAVQYGRERAEQTLPGILSAAGFAMPPATCGGSRSRSRTGLWPKASPVNWSATGDGRAPRPALSSITVTSAPPPPPPPAYTFGALIDR